MGESLFPLVTKHFLISPGNEKNVLEDEWSVSLNNGDQTKVGSIHFEDGVLHGEVRMAADLNPEYEKSKYIQELFYSMARFVFQFKEIREISTHCRHENDHRVRGLEKAGYVYRENKDGSDYYSMKKQKTSWTGLYVMIGLIAGFVIGLTISNLFMGTIIGVLSGAIIGYLLDKREADNEK
ncbi:MAG: hypothetical protein IJI01_11740 [Butyrivibrio sp.]|uniref:hypothetical protein n=1 Tax=Butyrivibrio sp. TaxID=28121 RepID=UPI0025BC7EC2|nr:hypothetical protein [Butyrivibrio sp.]MBQ6589339.1 hypothetical protein [Butyrivibrio sp.]